jgi:low affinity Fe/Cu permease
MRGSVIVMVILLVADWFWKGFGFSEIWYLWIVIALAAPFIGVNFVAPD